jgi:SPX domain protein involved in polyphosphate accumulation
MGGVVESAVPQVSSSSDPYHHERRFLLTRSQATAFFSAVARHTALQTYDDGRPISYTRTTYFDTDDLEYFRSCAGEQASRLRVREYATASSLEDVPVLSPLAFLELKRHSGSDREKLRLTAPSALLRQLIQRRTLPALDQEGLAYDGDLDVLRRALAAPTLAPRLTTWYRRTCITGEDKRVRITYDENLSFCRPRPVSRLGTDVGIEVAPRPNDVIAAGPPRVLEIKHWGDLPGWLASAVADLMPAPQFSKFRVGMIALTRKAIAPALETTARERAVPPLALGARQ